MRGWIKKQFKPWKTQDYGESFTYLGLMAIGSLFGCIFAEGYGVVVVGFGSLGVASLCAVASLVIAKYKRRARDRDE